MYPCLGNPFFTNYHDFFQKYSDGSYHWKLTLKVRLYSPFFLEHNPTNLVSLPRKLNNQYYHKVQLQSAGTKFVWHIYYKLPHKVHKPCFNTCRQHSSNLTCTNLESIQNLNFRLSPNFPWNCLPILPPKLFPKS